jgi:hypothetical protein
MNKLNKNEMCECGHLGGFSLDNVNSHVPNFQKGHGKCIECDCKQFTWVGFVDRKDEKWERI